MRRLFFTAMALGVLVPSAMWPDEGRIPIFKAPTVISVPGRYFVSANLSIASGSLITISASNVDLDLNGFVLSSTAAAPVITATGVDGVTIHNGTITGGSSNVSIDGRRIVIEAIHAVGAAGAAISLRATHLTVQHCLIRGAGDTGILVEDSPSIPSAVGTIADNVIENCNGGIVVATGGDTTPSSVSILNNRIRTTGSGYTGIFYVWGSGCLIGENTLQDIGGYGMFLQTDRCKIHDNVVAHADVTAIGLQSNGSFNIILGNVVSQSGTGLVINGSGNSIVGNVADKNTTYGIEIGGFRNNLEGNVANDNGSFGFSFIGGGHVYRRNMGRGNAGVAGGCGAPPCSPDLCVAPAGAATATSAGDNFLPGPPTFPACN